MKEDEFVAGVVHPRGAAGTRRGDQWMLHFILQPWKRDGEDAWQETLRIEKLVSHADLRQLMSAIKPYQVVRLRVLAGQSDQATLLDIVDFNAGDVELNQAAAKLSAKQQQPETRSDPVFGTLTLNRLIDWWKADVPWDAETIRLLVVPDDQGNLDGALRTAAAIWNDRVAWSDRTIAFAVERLLTLKNDSWLDEDEEEVTADEFRSRMRLEGVTAYEGGKFEFFYNDDDLFWGHSIRLEGNLEQGLRNATIAG